MIRKGIFLEPNKLDTLKSSLFYFDKLIIFPNQIPNSIIYKKSDFDKFLDEGIIEFLPVDKIIEEHDQVSKQKETIEDILHFDMFIQKISFAYLIKNQKSNELTPVMSNDYLNNFYVEDKKGSKEHKKSLTLNTVLEKFPIVDGTTLPYEAILEYKSDPESKRKFLAIKGWMDEISSKSMSYIELNDKIDYLIHDYRAHLELHKMRYQNSQLRTILKSTLEIIENLIKIKPSKIIDTAFSVNAMELKMREEELKLPSSQVAYIVDIQNKFG